MGCCTTSYNLIHNSQVSIHNTIPNQQQISNINSPQPLSDTLEFKNRILSDSLADDKSPQQTQKDQRQTKTIQVFDHSAIYSSNNTASNFYSKDHDNPMPQIVINEGKGFYKHEDELDVVTNHSNSIEISITPLNECTLNAGNTSSITPQSGFFSQYEKRLDTIRETNSEFYESKRVQESHFGTLLKIHSSFYEDNSMYLGTEGAKRKKSSIISNGSNTNSNNHNVGIKQSVSFSNYHNNHCNKLFLHIETNGNQINQCKSLSNNYYGNNNRKYEE